jgi:hypothetical protein
VIAKGSDPDEAINKKDTAQHLVHALRQYFGQDKQLNDPKI